MTKRQKTITKRFSVPENDPATLEWCELQGRQLSIALRIMIHRQIRESGLKNMFATDDLMLEAEQDTNFVKSKSQNKQTQAKTSKDAVLPDDKKQEPSKPADTSNNAANATNNATNNDAQNDNDSEDDLLKKMMMN